MRLASGAEALVARVLTADGIAGYGFTLNADAGVARDMAGWDALGRSKGVALFALLGGCYRRKINIVKDESPSISPDWTALRKDILDNKYDLLRIDPFAWGSVEKVTTIAVVTAAFDLGIALLAPNAHLWELQYCAALAAVIKGDDTRVIVRTDPEKKEIPVKSEPGIGVDWTAEPSFSGIKWQC